MDLEVLIQANAIAKEIKDSEIQTFLLKNQKKYEPNFLRLIADQWLARQKAKYKLPNWYSNEQIIFPPPLSVEQASSEITANYKAQVFSQNAGNLSKCIDLTAGMGIDSSAFAKCFNSVVYMEQNSELAKIARYNFEVLGQKNVEVLNKDAILFIDSVNQNQSFEQSFTHYYIDPARRDSSKNKVFRIEDCEPNVLKIKDLFANYLIKFSPFLDIKQAIEQLEDINEVHVVAVENEVKELLFLKNNAGDVVKVKCINFLSNSEQQIFDFDYGSEQEASVTYSKPNSYLYEPNAAILKAGAFKSIADRFNIAKLAPNSHLYTSDELVLGFPGRSFICEDVSKFDKKEILSKLREKQANISTRNFPMKPDEIRKKLDLKDGGDTYLFATEDYKKQKIILICKKVSFVSA